MSVELVCIPPERAADFWPVAEPFVEAGYLACDEFVPDDMLKLLGDGLLLLWVGTVDGQITAALVTDLREKPSGKVCRMLGAGGADLEHFQEWHGTVETYARAEGCAKVTSICRKGWIRALPGYRQSLAVIEKELA